MRTLILLAALCASALCSSASAQIFEKASGIATVGDDGIQIHLGGTNDGTDILPQLEAERFHPTVIEHRGEVIGVAFRFEHTTYLVAAGAAMGEEFWSGAFRHERTTSHWLSADDNFTTKNYRFEGETRWEFMERVNQHERDMFAAGFVTDLDSYIESDGGVLSSGGSVGQGYEQSSVSTQSMSTTFALYEDHDDDPGTPDRVRKRVITTWRRTGESLPAFIRRHTLFENAMLDNDWVQDD